MFVFGLLFAPTQEKYTSGQSFKVAKAFRNKLDYFGIYDIWEAFMASEVDFLHNDVQKKSEQILSNMNSLTTAVEMNVTAQPPKLVSSLVMELTKMCAPVFAFWFLKSFLFFLGIIFKVLLFSNIWIGSLVFAGANSSSTATSR